MSNNEEVYRIAVVSDLHVNDGGAKSSESWLSTDTPHDPNVNPFTSLYELINAEGLSADILLCCGDMADKANFSGQQLAWKSIHELAQKLGNAKVIGTAGNHDLDSRLTTTDFDPKGNLLSLSPPFPGIDEPYSNHYWAKNYAIHTDDKAAARILNINSCAFHGYGKNDNEFLHGRISETTLSAIQAELKRHQFDVNVGLFHHHPMKWDNVDEEDYSEMSGGSKLLELLEANDFGSWLLVHGHKHRSNISYAAGGSSSPVIFSSGSFSSKRLAMGAHRNEFYLIELERNPIKTANLPIAGTIRSWSWQFKSGWSSSNQDSRIPDRAGFGNRDSAEVLANSIAGRLRERAGTYVTWAEILSDINNLRYVLPADLKKTLNVLERRQGISIAYDKLGWPSQLSLSGQGQGE